MNVYDFDNTIFKGDSTFAFFRYCLNKYPKTRKNLPRTAWYGLLYGLRIVPKITFKQNMYRFLSYIDDIDKAVDEFTDLYLVNIKQWYLDQQREDDVVISASPYWLINSFCTKIGIKYVMASPVDKKTGICGPNCHGEEKVRRFYEMFPNGVIDEFYSDSYTDTPLARISKKAYLVKGDERKDWDR